MDESGDIVVIGATQAETACGLIYDVWYNTIYKKYDYETDKYTCIKGTRPFNDDFNDADAKTLNAYKAMKLYIEEK